MATVRYESRENAGHQFWVARHGVYAIESVRDACHVGTRWTHRPRQTSAAAAR
jgi:hypothetical protein